jgi:hypothetical protein
LVLWDVETGAEVKSLPRTWYSWWRENGRVLLTLGGNETGDNLGTHLLEPDNVVFADGTSPPTRPNGLAKLWEVTQPTLTYLVDAKIEASSFSTDDSWLAVNDVIWAVRSHSEGHYLRRSAISTPGLYPVFLSKDNVWAAPLYPGKGIYATLWQLAPEKREFVLPRPAYPEIDELIAENRLRSDPGWPPHPQSYLVGCSPDKKLALIASRLNATDEKNHVVYIRPLELWDLAAQRRLKLWNQEHYIGAPPNMGNLLVEGKSLVEDWKCVRFMTHWFTMHSCHPKSTVECRLP